MDPSKNLQDLVRKLSSGVPWAEACESTGFTPSEAKELLAKRDDGNTEDGDLVTIRQALETGLVSLMEIATEAIEAQDRARAADALLRHYREERRRIEKKKKDADGSEDPFKDQKPLFGEWDLKPIK